MMHAASRPLATVAALAAAVLPLAGCDPYYKPEVEVQMTRAVAVADLDGNLVPDVLSATAHYNQDGWLESYLSVMLQDQAFRFMLAQPIRSTTCLDPLALAVGDVDGDGRLDVAVACGATAGADDGIALHLQDPGRPGAFLPPTRLSTGAAAPTAVRLADLDGDGRLDLIVATSTLDGLQLRFQQHAPAPPGTFSAPVTLSTGAEPVAVAAADLTGAGRLDLVATTVDGRAVVLFHGAAPGSFLPGISYPAGLTPVAIEVVDLDGDGNPDLLMADSSGALLVMTQRAGGGAFDPVVSSSTFDWDSRALTVADMDGDGRLDVAVANRGRPGLPGSVSVFFQEPAPAPPGALALPTLYPGSVGPRSVVAADVAGSGIADLVIADGPPCIRYQIPKGSFSTPECLHR
jgi:hypothetical protein